MRPLFLLILLVTSTLFAQPQLESLSSIPSATLDSLNDTAGSFGSGAAYDPDSKTLYLTTDRGPGDGNSDGVPDQNVDEAANINGTTQLTAVAVTGSSYLHNAYISRNASTATSSCSDSTAGSPFCEFDDIVLAISPSTLITRMISASRLP